MALALLWKMSGQDIAGCQDDALERATYLTLSYIIGVGAACSLARWRWFAAR